MNQLKILPMAFVMIAGPQILSAIFLATSKQWLRNTAAYLLESPRVRWRLDQEGRSSHG
jgi:hypothetical protein